MGIKELKKKMGIKEKIGELKKLNLLGEAGVAGGAETPADGGETNSSS